MPGGKQTVNIDQNNEYLDDGRQEDGVGGQALGNNGNHDMLRRDAGNHDAEAEVQDDYSSQPAERFQYMAEILRSSKKGGLGIGWNSKNFRAVDNALAKLLELMDAKLDTADLTGAHKTLFDTMRAYNSLIAACERYVGDRHIVTDNGKRRRFIVKNIEEMAKKDLQGFRNYFDQHSTLPEEQRAKSVKEVLEKSRRRVIRLNTNESELTHVGGAASYIAVINEENTEGDGKASGFFKEEEILTRIKDRDEALQMVELVNKRKKWPESVYEDVKERIKKVYEEEKKAKIKPLTGALMREPRYYSDIAYHNFLDDLYSAASSRETTMDFMKKGALNIIGNEIGDSVNVSNRNVAASRLAEMLGVGDLIAHSETAELHDKNGTVKKGNLMQKAKGVEFAEAMQRITKEDYDKGNYAKNPKSVKGLDGSMTPQFVKSLVSLQVLDNLMGQVDRHVHNYFVELGPDNKLGSVQGIDNDFSFGDTLSASAAGYFGRSILTKNLTEETRESEVELNLKYMDKALADNILSLKETDARLMFYDVLEQGAIDAFCRRLKFIQIAIRKAQADKTKKVKFMERDEEWAADGVYESFYEKDAEGKAKYKQTTYLGQAMYYAKCEDENFQIGGRGANYNAELETEAKKEWMNHAGSLDEAVKYIDSLKTDDNKMKEYYKIVLEDIWKKDPDKFKENSCAVLKMHGLWKTIGKTKVDTSSK